MLKLRALALIAGSQWIMGAPPTLIRDVRIFDGERMMEHRSVLVDNGKIARVGGSKLAAAGAMVVEGRGRTLLPGLFDAHVHIGQDVRGSLRQALQFGVTTELDMFNSGDRLKEMKKIESEDPADLADIRTAGVGATAPGGHPTQMGGDRIPTIVNPDQAQAFVDERIAEGSDYIKIIYDDLASLGAKLPMLSRGTLEAVVAAAHKRHKLALVHVTTEAEARDAIAAGADGLAHMFGGEHVAPDFGRFAASHHAFVIATLETEYSICKEGNGAELAADPHLRPLLNPQALRGLEMKWPLAPGKCGATRQGIRQLHDARVPILAGTDAPVPGLTYGASLLGELALLVDAGLTPAEALASATSVPAKIFGLSDRGRILPDRRADLVLVEGDPSTDIRAMRNIVSVWKRGIASDRAISNAPAQASARKPERTDSVEIVDLTPRFLAFYDAAMKENASPDRRFELWNQLYGFVALPQVPDRQQRARVLVDAAWSRYPEALERIRLGPAGLKPSPESILREVAGLLKSETPVRVRLFVFVGGFESNAFSMGRQNGVQTIAIPAEDSDQQHLVTMTHEFTHAVQSELSHATGPQTVASVVLGEGLATRTVEALRPGFPEDTYIHGEEGWLQQCKDRLVPMLQGMKSHLNDEGPVAVSRFTLGDGATGLHREAYCAGWFVVGQMIHSGKTLADVAHIPTDKFTAEVSRAIEEQAPQR